MPRGSSERQLSLFDAVPAPADVPAGAFAEILRRVFGYAEFRAGQREAVEALWRGEDVQVVLPTAGGKSLCYQVPAIRAAAEGRGPTVVVSPLIALMEDQVRGLRTRGIEACALHGAVPWVEQRRWLDRLEQTALVYVSPERLANPRFFERLRGTRPAFAAVDEAHCVSEWGHEFRPEYRQLSVLKSQLGVPVIAVTATATPRVIDDIGRSLGLRAPAVILGGFERPNLRFEVHHVRGDIARDEWVAQALADGGWAGTRPPGRALVYAATRKRVKSAYQTLRKAGIKAGWYHAGRSDSARANAQKAFEEGRTPVLVATCAFGMGVDMPDVRLVAHVQAPSSIEAYYQEAGRAGRDGRNSRCVLLYAPGDAVTQARLRGRSPPPGAEAGWKALQDYVFSERCRQQNLVTHFAPGASPVACGRCDACTGPSDVAAMVLFARSEHSARQERREAAQRAADAVVLGEAEVEQVLGFVKALSRPVGKKLIAQGLRGSRAKAVKRRGLPNNPHHGALNGVPEEAILRTLDALLDDGRLVRKGRKYPTVWWPDKPVRAARPRTAKRPGRSETERLLRNYRARAARAMKVKPYQVFPDKTLKALVGTRPRTPRALAEVWGMGARRMAAHGEAILEIIRDSAADTI